MTEWLLVVDVSVDKDVERAWNDWYDNEHLPEIVACPGFKSGSRYKVSDGETPRYLTVYEVSGPEALKSDEFLSRRGWREFASHVRPQVNLYERLVRRTAE
ncbi:DUF4286 family protein [Jiella sp. MQZ9-1]|uniref:DUF4286 family protein n=1 Tax=Jiella flava TaxID=2816857 RepID=A0A939FZQ4_9HYPH|nr:DUF4286 family protein [Jiella flava]MBO0663190.1 DUF4286 family protein [Jiella flava]MCD2471764.1 DUF4286 family protein [Jiella flava]